MSQAVDTTPELEGLGTSEDDTWGQYPIDSILIRTESRTVFEVVRRMDKTYILDPEFQRDFVWDTKKQSKLVESVLMRIPLPVFYLAEDSEGRMIVVDGLQRLTTFQRFLSNQLRLEIARDDLNGKKFEDLPPKLQNRVEDCNLTFYIIDSKVPETVRLDIFERVNLGVPLSRQQMRNCLYQGPGTRFLKQAAELPLFQDVTGKGFRRDDMRDREAVNRFCAFKILGWDEYKGDIDDYLAQALQQMNGGSVDLDKMLTDFCRGLENARILFGKHAFRKHGPGQDGRNPVNISLWDVSSTCLSHYPPELIAANAEKLRESYYVLQANEDFKNAITLGTNARKKLQIRFDLFQDYLDWLDDALPT